MNTRYKIAAFGALNQGSYEMFAEWAHHYARQAGIEVEIVDAGPYPNAEAVTKPGRPLRGDALRDPALKEELLQAVADDARSLGRADIFCMPCMSMIGFQDGVEEKFGQPIVRLADALKDFYQDVEKLGVIHMRPATKRVEGIFGEKAIIASEVQKEQLLAAEEKARQTGHSDPVETVMEQITESFRDQGLTHALFARADAPKAQKGVAGQVKGIQIDSYFNILADVIIKSLTEH